MFRRSFETVLLGIMSLLAVAITWSIVPSRGNACPFCSAVSLTFSEEMKQSDVVVLAKRLPVPPSGVSLEGETRTPPAADDSGRTQFEIVKVLKGGKELGKITQLETIYFGESEPETTFLLMGIEPPQVSWGTPIALSERAVKYISALEGLEQKEPSERLRFFLDYLEDEDEMLARDAYDEFATISFDVVRQLKDRLPHDDLVKWVTDGAIPASRRRLYFTMLGIVGDEKDIPMLEEMLQGDNRQVKQGLDALINCYVMLKGPAGMDLVEKLFLSNLDAEYTDTYATIVALRIHGQEVKTLPRERILQGLRHVLDRPELADLVIPDLARWEDWSATDRLVELFKTADDQSNWVRVPVINFLRASPEPRAKEYLAELAQIDPDAMKRATSFMPFPAGDTTDAATTVASTDGNSNNSNLNGSNPVGSESDSSEQVVSTGETSPATGDVASVEVAADATVATSTTAPAAETDAEPAKALLPQTTEGVTATQSRQTSPDASLQVNENATEAVPEKALASVPLTTSGSTTPGTAASETTAAGSVPSTDQEAAAPNASPIGSWLVTTPIVAAIALLGLLWFIMRDAAKGAGT